MGADPDGDGLARRGTVSSTMRRAAHLSGGARCGAGAGCSAIKYQPLLARRYEQPHKIAGQTSPSIHPPIGNSYAPRDFLPEGPTEC